MAAMLFAVQENRAKEAQFFAKMVTASYQNREYGHTGQGFSYLWSALGANIGGALAVAEHLKPVRWHLDLSRRTDGSFAYDGAEAVVRDIDLELKPGQCVAILGATGAGKSVLMSLIPRFFDPTAGRLRGISHRAHQSGTPAAVDQAPAARDHRPPERLGRGEVFRVQPVAGLQPRAVRAGEVSHGVGRSRCRTGRRRRAGG